MKKLFIKNKTFAILLVLVFSFFLPKLILGKVPIPSDSLLGLYHPWRDNSYEGYSPEKFPVKNPLITDPILQTYPWRFLSVENIKDLHFPLWNPYSFSGQPLLANMQSASFQLLNIIFVGLPFNLSWGIQIILPIFLTSIFMFLFLKSLKLKDFAAAYGALVLSFSGFFVSWMVWGTIITTAMWLPLILFNISKYFETKKPIYFLILTLASTQTLLSGHMQTAFYIALCTLLYIVFLNIQKKDLKLTAHIFLALFLSVLISAIQILPTIEFSILSNRNSDQAYFSGRNDWFIPLQNLIQLVAPNFFGNPTTYNYWGIWNYAEFVSYIGIAPLFFVIIALLKKSKNSIFFLFIITVSLLLGLSNYFSELIYKLNIPVFSSFQPSRIIFLLTFSLSALSAIGMQTFLEKKDIKKYIIVFLLIFAPLIILFVLSKYFTKIPAFNTLNASIIANHNLLLPMTLATFLMFAIIASNILQKKKIIVLIVFIFTIFDLFTFAYKFIPFNKMGTIFPNTRSTTFLQNQKKPFRVMSTDRRILNPNTSIPYRIESLSGYDPLYIKKYAQLYNSMDQKSIDSTISFNRFITPQNYDSDFATLMNAKYILTFDTINDQNYKKVLEEGETKIYEKLNVLDRAFFTSSIIKSDSPRDELISLQSKTDFKEKSYSQQFKFSEGDKYGTADFLLYEDQKFIIKTTTKQESPLVISNVNYPGWKAYVDGIKTPIKEVNFALQSIIVPQGIHIIEFRYVPESFYFGLVLSIAGMFATLLIFIYLWKKRFQ
jgi:uncharacterized membrane protein YfhO